MHEGVKVILDGNQEHPGIASMALVRLAFEERAGNNVNTEMKLPEHILMTAQIYATLELAKQVNFLTNSSR